MMIEKYNQDIPILRQCELLGLCRSTFYYQPALENAINLTIMRYLDETYTAKPFLGVEKMTYLVNINVCKVNVKRIRRLMRLMGLYAIYPKPQISLPEREVKKYPYLLSGLDVLKPNQVWSTDITYIRMNSGFLYLVAVIDWYSRYVLSWELSNTLDSSFCMNCLDKALTMGKPEIFNSDQGCQFTSTIFTSKLEKSGIKVSMDGKGRAFDNIFIERLWRSVKYEEVYLKNYKKVRDAHDGISSYFTYYNNERPHQSLTYQTPSKVHYQ